MVCSRKNVACSHSKVGGRLGIIERTGHLGLQLVGDRQPFLVEGSPAGQKRTGQPSRKGRKWTVNLTNDTVDLLC